MASHPGRLQDKVALVTGGGAGIGRATAELFVAEGARVMVSDRDGEAARAVAAGLGENAAACAADVADEAAVTAMVAATVARFGRIDVLVANAGFGIRGSVTETSVADWDAVMAVNVRGVFLCAKHAIPAMERTGGGTIVNTASNVALVGLKDRAAYVASKGAVAALTRSMAIDHAPRIRVNAVAPGPTASTYFDRMLAEVPDPEAFRAGLANRGPMGRVGEPAEIAKAILYLASDESSFATGTLLVVDGGHTAW
jgi:meso-butanediol dehydrogenase / (S,S)-butanediol dehydrogenase / diacetyl reductase